MFRSNLQKPGPDTETGRYPADRSYGSVGPAETHTGSGSQCGDDDAQPQRNHPEREFAVVLLQQSLSFVSVTDESLCTQMTALSVGYIQTYRDSVDSLGESVDMSIKVYKSIKRFSCRQGNFAWF